LFRFRFRAVADVSARACDQSPNDKSSLAATDLAAIDRFGAISDAGHDRPEIAAVNGGRKKITDLSSPYQLPNDGIPRGIPADGFSATDLIYIALNNANRADSSGRATEGAFRAKLSFAASSSRLPAVDCG